MCTALYLYFLFSSVSVSIEASCSPGGVYTPPHLDTIRKGLNMSSFYSHASPTVAVIMVLCVILILSLVVSAMSSKVQKSTLSDLKELYVDAGTVSPSQVYYGRKDAIYDEYIKHFYSSPNSSFTIPAAIHFMPRYIDAICSSTNADIVATVDGGCENNFDLRALTITDTQATLSPTTKCASSDTMREPLIREDAAIRILDGLYEFSKTCVSLSPKMIGQPMPETTRLTIDPGMNRAALFIMLSRPILLSTPNSILYNVTYLPKSVMVFNSETSGFTFDITRVDNAAIWPKEFVPINMQGATVTTTFSGSNSVSATIYYLKYLSPLMAGAIVPLYDRSIKCLTFVYAVPPSLPSNTETTVFDSNYIRANISIASNLDPAPIALMGTACRFNVVIGTESMVFSAFTDGFVIVTYVTNALYVVYISRKGCIVEKRQVTKSLAIPVLELAAIESKLKQFKVSVPASCYPLTNTGIPNFYSMFSSLIRI